MPGKFEQRTILDGAEVHVTARTAWEGIPALLDAASQLVDLARRLDKQPQSITPQE